MAVLDIVNILALRMTRFKNLCFAVFFRSQLGKLAVIKPNPSVQRGIAYIMGCVWLILLCLFLDIHSKSYFFIFMTYVHNILVNILFWFQY